MPARTTVALLLSATVACTIAGCGGSGGAGGASSGATSPVALLKETFDAPKPIESGRVSVDLDLAETKSSTTQHTDLKLSGPFEEAGNGKLPRFALDVDLESEGHTLSAGAVSTSGKLYVELEGSAFVAPRSTTAALQESFAKASKGSGGAASSFSALGIDPGRWLTHPVTKGEPSIGGVKTTEVQGGLNLPALLQDTDRLTGAAGKTGLGGLAGTLSPKLIAELAKAVTSAKVDVYTGVSDHLLRRLALTAAIAPRGAARAALGGLSSAELDLQVNLSEIGKPQKIEAPLNAKPLSQLFKVLEGVGLVSQAS